LFFSPSSALASSFLGGEGCQLLDQQGTRGTFLIFPKDGTQLRTNVQPNVTRDNYQPK
jgi:hypothetical protein